MSARFGGVEAGGVTLGGDAFQNTPRIVRHGTEHDRHLRFDDAAFLGGDFGNRMPQPIAMVKTNAGDDADGGLLDDVRRIEPSAQAGLQNKIVNLLLSIERKRRRRQELEVGEVSW